LDKNTAAFFGHQVLSKRRYLITNLHGVI